MDSTRFINMVPQVVQIMIKSHLTQMPPSATKHELLSFYAQKLYEAKSPDFRLMYFCLHELRNFWNTSQLKQYGNACLSWYNVAQLAHQDDDNYMTTSLNQSNAPEKHKVYFRQAQTAERRAWEENTVAKNQLSAWLASL